LAATLLIDINSINKPSNIRNKRLIDVFVSLILMITYPFLTFFVENKSNYFLNLFRVFFGKISWVGYKPVDDKQSKTLPKIRVGVVSQVDALCSNMDANTTMRLNMLYAKDYKVYNDIAIIFKSFKKLGN
jgi:hypothetical protein